MCQLFEQFQTSLFTSLLGAFYYVFKSIETVIYMHVDSIYRRKCTSHLIKTHERIRNIQNIFTTIGHSGFYVLLILWLKSSCIYCTLCNDDVKEAERVFATTSGTRNSRQKSCRVTFAASRFLLHAHAHAQHADTIQHFPGNLSQLSSQFNVYLDKNTSA